MLEVRDLSLIFPDKKLFEDVNISFKKGNCYGIIGANGAGKSTFLKIIAGDIDSTKGEVFLSKGLRMSVLRQNHYEFDECNIVDTVIMGYKELYNIMIEKDDLYNKTDFTEADGLKAGELEMKFADMNGWEAESDARKLLSNLEINEELQDKKLKELTGKDKVKVLLAQTLFANPDILVMDEPTNDLDFKAIKWLEEFLINYENTVIVVSHDRHFLNNVCTHMVDIDFGTAKLYPGNYDFWYESSKLALKLTEDANKKKEAKIKELEAFIARFSANASKSKQATSRKKSLEKITLDEIKPSSRKYPYISVNINRPLGKEVLSVSSISKTIDGIKVLDDVSFEMGNNDKVILLGDDIAKTTLLKILAGEIEPDSGEIKWGQTVERTYLPVDNNNYFKESDRNLIEWLANYSKDQSESFLRGFLGRMLFSGDSVLKKVNVLSGGEKVRCMFSKLMLSNANFLILDQPTNHLDLESIEAVNDGLMSYKGSIIFTSHDYKFIDSIANKVIELGSKRAFTIECSFNDYINDSSITKKVEQFHKNNK
ncbi:MAG: ABC-F family ATP-binding cassette domain-containing protein [Bacilli bacterium]|nr:ABC-F family ATP-binding cassette domain-containing protein [Bacilli bacterium]